jgi:hypothetical protein
MLACQSLDCDTGVQKKHTRSIRQQSKTTHSSLTMTLKESTALLIRNATSREMSFSSWSALVGFARIPLRLMKSEDKVQREGMGKAGRAGLQKDFKSSASKNVSIHEYDNS